MSATYLHLLPESTDFFNSLPESPSRVVVIVEAPVTPTWQHAVSRWLVEGGCLYMMAWGLDCSSWDDSVDMANLEMFDFEPIPEERFVMTTWHEEDPLQEVFWYAKNLAHHPMVEVESTVLLHISAQPREAELLAAYAACPA